MTIEKNKPSNTMKLAEANEKYIPNMRVVYKTIDLSHKYNKFRLYLASDWHMGTTGEILGPIKDFCDHVEQDPAGFLAINGDLFNLSKEGQQRDVLSIDQIIDLYVEILNPLARQNKLLFILNGNHDRRMLNAFDVDLVKQIVERLKAQNNNLPVLAFDEQNSLDNTAAPYYAVVNFFIKREDAKEGKVPITVLFHHGDGMKGVDSLINLYNIVENTYPDIITCGHTHQPQMKTVVCSAYDKKLAKTFTKPVTLVVTKSVGSPTYADEKNYPLNDKGAGIVLEVATSNNPLKDFPNQREFLIACEEIKDNLDLDTRIKQTCVDCAENLVEQIKMESLEAQIDAGRKFIDAFIKWKQKNTNMIHQRKTLQM